MERSQRERREAANAAGDWIAYIGAGLLSAHIAEAILRILRLL